MKTLKTESYGFSAVELVLVLVIVGIVGAVGWYVVHAGKTTNSSYSNNSTNNNSTNALSKTASNVDNAKKAKPDYDTVKLGLGGLSLDMALNTTEDKENSSSDSGLVVKSYMGPKAQDKTWIESGFVFETKVTPFDPDALGKAPDILSQFTLGKIKAYILGYLTPSDHTLYDEIVVSACNNKMCEFQTEDKSANAFHAEAIVLAPPPSTDSALKKGDKNALEIIRMFKSLKTSQTFKLVDTADKSKP